MSIYKDGPSNNGDDSVLITDLKRCRDINSVDRFISKITRKPRLIDRFKSYLSKKDIKKCKSEITREHIRSATSSPTFNLSKAGSNNMKSDRYTIANDKTTEI